MKKVYVGMDVGSKQCAAVAVDENGRMVDSDLFKTTERNIISFFERQKGEVHVLIEECEIASWIRGIVKPFVARVVVCDPKHNAWIAKGNMKDDPVDAGKLAELLRINHYTEVWHTDDEDIASLKATVKHYDESTKRLVRVQGQIKAQLRRQGVITSGNAVYGAKGRAKALEEVSDPKVRAAIEADYELMDYLTSAKADAHLLMTRTSRSFPVTSRLREIPGVGPVVAASFVARVGDPHRFNRGGLSSYCCLGIVKRYSDGSSLGREHLNRDGNRDLKALSRTVFLAAMRCKAPNGIRRFYEQSLERTRNHEHARLNTQRKILALMLAIWRDGTRYRDDLVTGGAFTDA